MFHCAFPSPSVDNVRSNPIVLWWAAQTHTHTERQRAIGDWVTQRGVSHEREWGAIVWCFTILWSVFVSDVFVVRKVDREETKKDCEKERERAELCVCVRAQRVFAWSSRQMQIGVKPCKRVSDWATRLWNYANTYLQMCVFTCNSTGACKNYTENQAELKQRW